VRYLSGLDPRYSHVVKLQQYTTFGGVYALAHRVEQQKESKVGEKKPFPRTNPFSKWCTQFNLKTTSDSSQIAPKTLSPQDKPPSGHNANRRCYKCHDLGHIASDCPNRRLITWQKYQEAQEEEIEEEREVCLMEEQEEEEVVAEPDEGEMLVIRRTLNVRRSAKDEQREYIFHNRFTIQGKVCSWIVDSGGCSNIASITLIEKLGP